MALTLLVLAVVLFTALLYAGRGYWAWVSAVALGLGAWKLAGVDSPNAFLAAAALAIAAALVFGVPGIRRRLHR